MGLCDNNIRESYNEGAVVGFYRVGGIDGGGAWSGNPIIRDCYNIGNITSTYKAAGGIMGGGV